jgi:hypothetical protein
MSNLAENSAAAIVFVFSIVPGVIGYFVGAGPVRKTRKPLLELARRARERKKRILQEWPDWNQLSNPAIQTKLPFPFVLLHTLPTDRFNFTGDADWNYMGREKNLRWVIYSKSL